ncbi:FAD-binding oxidoreductase [Chloroflexi bacterium TSY]|nr:FAD-binding oxidoreductase [Chloroflexi bacterium TSY]
MNTHSTYEAVVVGGGIIGASAAYHLVYAGAKTLLVDRRDEGRATSAGAGILAPKSSNELHNSWSLLMNLAFDYYPVLAERLSEEGVGDTGFARCGKLTLAMSDEEQALLAQIQSDFADDSIEVTDDLPHLITPEDAHGMFPALTPDIKGALYYPTAARVNGRQIEAALLQAATQRGLTILPASADALVLAKQKVVGIQSQQEIIYGGAVILAGGAWSSQFGQQLGVQIPIEPQRGQIVHLELPNIDTSTWPILDGFRGHYIVCWPGGRVVVGATRETDSGYAAYTTASGILEVLREALRVAPGLAQARLVESRVGLRPMSIDGLPIISNLADSPGVTIVTGHGPNGLQLGPYSGKLAAQLALGQETDIETKAFELVR